MNSSPEQPSEGREFPTGQGIIENIKLFQAETRESMSRSGKYLPLTIDFEVFKTIQRVNTFQQGKFASATELHDLEVGLGNIHEETLDPLTLWTLITSDNKLNLQRGIREIAENWRLPDAVNFLSATINDFTQPDRPENRIYPRLDVPITALDLVLKRLTVEKEGEFSLANQEIISLDNFLKTLHTHYTQMVESDNHLSFIDQRRLEVRYATSIKILLANHQDLLRGVNKEVIGQATQITQNQEALKNFIDTFDNMSPRDAVANLRMCLNRFTSDPNSADKNLFTTNMSSLYRQVKKFYQHLDNSEAMSFLRFIYNHEQNATIKAQMEREFPRLTPVIPDINGFVILPIEELPPHSNN